MTTHNTLHDTLRDLLAQGMAGVDSANSALREATDRRKSAYTLYVDAALAATAAPDPVALVTEVSDALFAELRVSASVSDTHGNTYKIACKPGKNGEGFLVPSSFSAAKSYTTEALRRSVPLRDEDGSPRTFSQIRKDVQALAEQERREQARGDDAIRFDCADMIAALQTALEGADSAGLADLYKRLRKATHGMGESKAPEAQSAPEAQGAALAAAA